MAFLHPIQPWLLADREPFAIDGCSEEERRSRLMRGPAGGLETLLGFSHLPASANAAHDLGVWTPADGEGVYLHREEYLAGGRAERSRWSVIAAVDPEASPLAAVVPADAEEVDRLGDILRRAGADPGGVSALYRDPEHHLEKLIDAREGIPARLHYRLRQGWSHSIWKLSEDEGRGLLSLLERCGGAIVGDVALYKAMLRVTSGVRGRRLYRPLVRFYNQRDFGVALAATARLHRLPAGFVLNRFMAVLHQRHEVNEYPIGISLPRADSYRRFLETVRSEGIVSHVIGILVRGVPTAFLIKRERGGQADATDLGGPPEVAREFSVEWAERELLELHLGCGPQRPVAVLNEPLRAPEILADGAADIAFILNPPPKRFIPDLATAGWRLPVGALQMDPPPPRGLLLQPLPSECAAE